MAFKMAEALEADMAGKALAGIAAWAPG